MKSRIERGQNGNIWILDVLQEELDKNFPFDYEISWDKRNHAVEVSFLLEAQNAAGVEMLDEDGEVSSDDIRFEEAVLFYNPAKSTVNCRRLSHSHPLPT